MDLTKKHQDCYHSNTIIRNYDYSMLIRTIGTSDIPSNTSIDREMPLKQGDPADGRQQSPTETRVLQGYTCPQTKTGVFGSHPQVPSNNNPSHQQTSNIVRRCRWNFSPLDS